jgi:hypothetical protein
MLGLRNLDKAFNRFFDNVKKGIKGGYPSWRSADRNNSVYFKAWEHKKTNPRGQKLFLDKTA